MSKNRPLREVTLTFGGVEIPAADVRVHQTGGGRRRRLAATRFSVEITFSRAEFEAALLNPKPKASI